jgi:hypothetical protein
MSILVEVFAVCFPFFALIGTVFWCYSDNKQRKRLRRQALYNLAESHRKHSFDS